MSDSIHEQISILKDKRGAFQRFLDFILFPFRGLVALEDNKWGLTSLRHERYHYVSRYCKGRVLDVGCGRNNVFINEFMNGNGWGIDVYKYEGLQANQVFPDLSRFPCEDKSYDTIVFIANLNHVPPRNRLTELREAFRCLNDGGRIVLTMGNPVAEILAHKLVYFNEKVLGIESDVDYERGMSEEEEYYVKYTEIKRLLKEAGFVDIRSRTFWEQWGLNKLFVGHKPY
jgi:SAM-dependent methyltransferase